MTTNPEHPEAACLPAGRYEFKDAGIYIGEWLNEKAVGLGLITKDKCQGEYTGLWDGGMEKSGVFLWPNAPGAMYEGEWANNRRNGYGVFTREDWVIKGKFVDDFISLGVKCKENSIGRFEGEFENGFPSFGVETYADGGNYSGEYKTGIREGLGVRTSIPYGDIINFFPEEAAIAAEMALKVKSRSAPPPGPHGVISLSESGRLERRGSLLSQRSGDVADLDNADSLEEDEPYSGRNPDISGITGKARDLRMSTKFRCGFVLSAQRSELMVRRQHKMASSAAARKSRESSLRSNRHARTRSLTNLFNRSLSRESVGQRQGSANGRPTHSQKGTESIFNLDQDDAIDPETIETYAGQWEADARHGYGVCERTDGVSYEGQWYKNQRHGYGQTRFKDGSLEQGRYQFGKLVFLSWPKGTKPHLLLYNYHIRVEVGSAVKRANVIAEQARLRATEARENLDNVLLAVEQAQNAAELARDYSLETRELVKEMYPDFEQPGIKYLDDMVRLMRVTKRGNQTFEAALHAAQDVLAGVGATVSTETGNALENIGESETSVLPGENSSIKGIPISRAGSYRLRRQSKKRAKRLRRKESGSGHLMPEFDEHYFEKQDQTLDFTESPSTQQQQQPFTLVVPQVTRYDHDGSSPDQSADARRSADQRLSRTHKVKHNETANQHYLNVPGRRDSPDLIETDEDSLEYDVEQDHRNRASRSPSVVTTYLTIPRVTDLHPESEIQIVPMDKLLTNTNWLNDHFYHYVAPAKTDESRADPVVVNRSSWAVNHALSYDEPQPDLGTRRLQLPGHGRRRTVPSILTQKPIVPETKYSLHGHTMNRPPDSALEADFGKQSDATRAGIILPDIVISAEAKPEIARTESIYFVDDGVRKKLSAEQNYDRSVPSTPFDDVFFESHSSASNLEIGTKHMPIAYDNVDSVGATNRVADKQVSPVNIRPIKPISVVSNVLLEDIQDEIPELSMRFKESRMESRGAAMRCSVPNMASSSSKGFTQEELSALSAEWQAKHARELARQKQGELVIHLTDLLDWWTRNSLTITVLLLNGTLAYLFACLMMDSRTSN